MTTLYRYHGSKEIFDINMKLLQEHGYKAEDITEELHKHDNEANLINGGIIWGRKLRQYGQRVTAKPKHPFIFRHTSSDTLAGTEAMYHLVTNRGGKVNPSIASSLQGGKQEASQMWTFCIISQRDVYFVTDHLEADLLVELVRPIPKGGDIPLKDIPAE